MTPPAAAMEVGLEVGLEVGVAVPQPAPLTSPAYPVAVLEAQEKAAG